jgi:hypothetical protein
MQDSGKIKTMGRRKTMSASKIMFPFMIFTLSLICLFPGSVFSGQVIGGVSAVRDRNIQILLKITAPAPNTVILTLHLPSGITVMSAKPAFAKALPEKGEVNWLLSDVRPGNLNITCRLNKKVKPSEILTTVRYKSPLTGKMEEDTLTDK